MGDMKYAVFLVFVGCVLSRALAETRMDDTPHQSSEANSDEEHDPAKRYGNLLSSGYKLGKKNKVPSTEQTETQLKEKFKKWHFGSVLGKGFKGKRVGHFESMFKEDKRGDENIDRDIEAVDLAGPIDDKRWIGDIYGTGYDYHKRRDRRDAPNARFIRYFGRGMTPDNENKRFGNFELETLDHSEDDMDSLDGFDDSSDLDPGMETAKRYIGTNPGHRFNFGKRHNEMLDGQLEDDYFPGEDDGGFPVDKRRFGYMLGRGYAFGKRHYYNQHEKRPFGYVLGRGFAFGKRSYEDSYGGPSGDEMDSPLYLPENGDEPEMNKRMGLVLGRGFLMGKRGSKRFGWILGRGLKFGKRSGPQGTEELPAEYFVDDDGHIEELYEKRFGHILGSGYRFGKRYPNNYVGYTPDKRGFGFMLGRGFRLGKR